MSNYAKSMTGKTKGKKQVNPTYSARAPRVGTTNGGKQINPTYDAGKSQTAVDAHVKKQPLNRTFAATNNENSKGGKNKSMSARGSKALSTAKNPQPIKFGIIKSNKGGMGIKGLQTPKRNIPGSVGKGSRASGPSRNHTLKAKVESVPTRNQSAPFGQNGHTKVPMTVARLNKLGL